MDQLTNELNHQIQESAFQFLQFVARKADFLDFSPSVQAAAVITFSIQLSHSFLAEKVGLNQFNFKELASPELNHLLENKNNKSNPFSIWTLKMETITRLRQCEIKKAYSILFILLNEKVFNKILTTDP